MSKVADDYMPWRDQTVLDIIGDEMYHDDLKNGLVTVKLTSEQISSIAELLNREVEANNLAGDSAYNIHWENIKMALGYAIVK